MHGELDRILSDLSSAHGASAHGPQARKDRSFNLQRRRTYSYPGRWKRGYCSNRPSCLGYTARPLAHVNHMIDCAQVRAAVLHEVGLLLRHASRSRRLILPNIEC
jgi:hypothetical protein